MKKKVMAMALTVALTLSMSMTAFAASSTTSSNSGNSGSSSSAAATTTATVATTPAVDKAAPGQVVNTDTVSVAVVAADGSVQTTNLTAYVATAEKNVVALTATSEDACTAVSALMTTPATPMFQATINALNGKAAINNCGTVKTKAVAKDAFGNVIASAGSMKAKGVTNGSLVMLMSVNADGTVEFVEGVVDPVTGEILGAFKGTPKTISVLVFVPAV